MPLPAIDSILNAPPRAAAGLALATLITLVPMAAPASAGETPSEWWLAKMNREFPTQAHIRLRGPADRVVLRQVTVDSLGATGYREATPLLADAVPAGVPGNEPVTVSWARISDVELAHSATGLGAMIGASAGTVAAIVTSIIAGHDGDDNGSELRAALMIAGGAGVGAALGSTRERWSPYYPPPGTRKTAFEVRLKESHR
jgi:hypothetical protein